MKKNILLSSKTRLSLFDYDFRDYSTRKIVIRLCYNSNYILEHYENVSIFYREYRKWFDSK